jgi:Siphovirus ReqiPepy6 Gp37-like protein
LVWSLTRPIGGYNMDLFKFTMLQGHETVLQGGEAINGMRSVIWTERYRGVGEFEIKSFLSSGLIDKLPLGTLISHVNTLEVMMVEDHQITENKDEDPIVTITGRAFYAFLDHRVVGMIKSYQYQDLARGEYAIAADYTWKQAVVIINDCIQNPATFGVLEEVYGYTGLTGTGAQTVRTYKRMSALTAILELLSFDDLGIRTLRKNVFGGLGSSTQTRWDIFKGSDKTSSVIFSWERGDVIGADYLWSDRNILNAVLALTTYFTGAAEIDINGNPYGHSNGYLRREGVIDATDIDSSYNGNPAGSVDQAPLVQKASNRAYQQIAISKRITLTRADIAPNTQYIYRQHYNLGDLVMISANYGTTQVMRVIEHTEIEDENGRTAHPTLAIPTS